MSLPPQLESRLSVPAICAPLFIVSVPELVIAACKAGVVGSFPALNARPIEMLEAWLKQVGGALGGTQAAPYAVNLIVHRTNTRLEQDLALTVKYEAPMVISSVGHPGPVVEAVHGYGGLVFADVIHIHHAKKALDAGVDGLILVCAGAGGHAGTLSPFAMVRQVREFWDGPLVLAGAISDGAGIAAARALGADLAYLGTRFIATREANANPGFKQMIVDSAAADIVYTEAVSGIKGNFLRPSLERAGLDLDAPPTGKEIDMGDELNSESKAWKDIWSAGQGVGSIHDVPSVAELVARLKAEYEAAWAAAPTARAGAA